ncbi:hypothetical protein BH10ACI3_BH10ACI3_27480 [soil metagenome]
MRMNLILGLTLAGAIGLLAAGCQSTATNNAIVNANTVTNSVHDMSNMNGMSNMNHDMSTMQGHDMSNMNSDPGAAEAPYDLQFLDSMIHHHTGAVTMAKMVLGKSERPELKAFAQKIIDDQIKEIAVLQQLRSQWYAGKPPAVNMEMAGMVGGMKIMNGEHMKEMAEMKAEHFDEHFLNMMIAHHEGAVTMSQDAQKKAEHPEIKKLAETIIKAQQPEIDQMKKWQAAWKK